MEIDTTIHEEITGMIAQKYNDAINNILLIWVYLVLEGKVVYLLKKSTKLQRSKNPVTIFEFQVDYGFSEYNKNNMTLNMEKLGSKYGKALRLTFIDSQKEADNKVK